MEKFTPFESWVAVLPVEWWDPKWINDNIQPKLEGHSGETIARAQEKSPRKAAKPGKAGKPVRKKKR